MSAFVQTLACHQYSAKPISKSMLICCQLGPWKHIPIIFRMIIFFIKEDAFVYADSLEQNWGSLYNTCCWAYERWTKYIQYIQHNVSFRKYYAASPFCWFYGDLVCLGLETFTTSKLSWERWGSQTLAIGSPGFKSPPMRSTWSRWFETSWAVSPCLRLAIPFYAHYGSAYLGRKEPV